MKSVVKDGQSASITTGNESLLSGLEFIERRAGQDGDQCADACVEIVAAAEPHHDQEYAENNDGNLGKHADTPWLRSGIAPDRKAHVIASDSADRVRRF